MPLSWLRLCSIILSQRCVPDTLAGGAGGGDGGLCGRAVLGDGCGCFGAEYRREAVFICWLFHGQFTPCCECLLRYLVLGSSVTVVLYVVVVVLQRHENTKMTHHVYVSVQYVIKRYVRGGRIWLQSGGAATKKRIIWIIMAAKHQHWL